MSIVEIISGACLLLASVCIIILCLLQDQKQDQNMTSAISGASNNDSFYGKNEGRTQEAIIRRITTVLAVVFFVATVVANIVPIFVK